MRLLLYGRSSDLLLQAVAAGATALGWEVVFYRDSVFTQDQVDRADAVLVRGLHGPAARIRDTYRARGVPVLVEDLPKIRAQQDAHYLGLDSLHWLPADRAPTDRLARLSLPEPPVPSGDAVLVLGQKPNDAAHGLGESELVTWAEATAAILRDRGNRPRLWRPHPRCPGMRPRGFDAYLEADRPLAEAFALAAWVVAYNSTASIDAVIAGLPVVVSDPASFVAPVATVGIPEGDPPQLDAETREAFLARLAYTQWTPAELATGFPVAFALGLARAELTQAPRRGRRSHQVAA